MKKNTALILAFILIGNLIFRTVTLSNCCLWYDETFSVYYSQMNISGMKNTASWDITPPFYYFVLHYWMLVFGIGETAVRMLSILLTSVAAVILFLFARKHFNFETAIYSSLLFLSCNAIFLYAQEGRTYALVVLLAMASSYVFLSILENPKWYHVPLLGVINWAGIYSHYFFVVLIIIQFGIVAISFRRKSILFYILGSLIAYLLFQNWIHRFLDVVTNGRTTSDNNPPSFHQLLLVITEVTNGYLLLYIFIALLVIGCIFYFKSVTVKFSYIHLLKTGYVFLWTFLPIVSVYLTGSKGIMFITRYFLFSVPAFFLLISFLVVQIPMGKFFRYGLITALFVIALVNINYKIDKGYDYRSAAPFVIANTDKNTLVIIQIAGMLRSFTYYFDKDLFKDYTHIDSNLLERNILAIDDSTSISNKMLAGFSKIILTQTFCDQNSNLFLFLKKRFNSKKTYSQFQNILITVFENPIQIISFTQEERIATIKTEKQLLSLRKKN